MKNRKTLLFKSALCLLLCISMLVGTTFAWFTDKVVSGKNTIAAGNLDVELYHSNAAVQNEQVKTDTLLFKDLQGNPILWEPGVVSYENLRVTNAGDLALSYQLAMETAKENFVVYPDGTQYGLSQILKVGIVEGGITATDRAGVVASVADANWTTLTDFIQNGTLTPAGKGVSEKTWGVVVYWQPGENDNLWNLNNGKQLNEGETLSIELGVKLTATQEPFENDSFDKNYDAQRPIPNMNVTVVTPVVDKVAADKVVAPVTVADAASGVTAQIPEGVALNAGATEVTLSVKTMESSNANIKVEKSETKVSLDVHIEGVDENNNVPMLITLENYLPIGLNTTSVKMYHVEDDSPVEMTLVTDPINHNEFSYDPATGTLVLCVASFSEYVSVTDDHNLWKGTLNTDWYNTTDTVFTLTTAEQLAGFGAIVDGTAEGIAADTFAGKTVYLGKDIDLGGEISFNPIGYGYANNDGKPFSGTFDGNGHHIHSLKQDGGELGLSYCTAGGGLFASVANGTIKNLCIGHARIRMECVDMGVLVGYSQGNCTYENIEIIDCQIANYQRYTGGLVGEVSAYNGAGNHTFNNIHIDPTTVIGSLWGDFDCSVGGVIGGKWDETGVVRVNMRDCIIACKLDVYNDVTAAYQWHAYRRAGWLIGNSEEPTADGKNAYTATASYLTCSNVKVYYQDWVNYMYCEFTNDNNPGKGYPWVRVDVGYNNPAYSNPRYGFPKDNNGAEVTNGIHYHKEGDAHQQVIPFCQLYGGGQGVYGGGALDYVSTHAGVEIIKLAYVIEYMDGTEVLDVEYVSVAQSASNYPLDKPPIDGYQWIDKEGNPITAIPAGTKTNQIVILDDPDKLIAYFVDRDGTVIYQETFTKGQTALKGNIPNPPAIPGYYAQWEPYTLKEKTESFVVQPLYTLAENMGIIDQNTPLIGSGGVFEMLAQGKDVVMVQDLVDKQGNASSQVCCVVASTNPQDTTARLNLNGQTLDFTFGSNGNKDWRIFDIKDGRSLDIFGGLEHDGILRMELTALNGNTDASIFDIEGTGKLVLERGVTVELVYDDDFENRVYVFRAGSPGQTLERIPLAQVNAYPGLTITKTTEGGTTTVRIVVTATTIIEEGTIPQTTVPLT